MRDGAAAFHAGLDAIPDDLPADEKIRLALRAHLRTVAGQLDVATVFTREWRYLEGERREEILAERRRYEERFRALFREGRELGELRTDLDDAASALLALSAANWAYTWLTPERDTDALADRFCDVLLDGLRGYASREGGAAVRPRPRSANPRPRSPRRTRCAAGSPAAFVSMSSENAVVPPAPTTRTSST